MTATPSTTELAQGIRARIRMYLTRIEALEIQLQNAGNAPSLSEIMQATSQVTGLTVEAITSESRLRELTDARKLFVGKAMAFGYGFSVIARFIKRHHTSVMNAQSTFNDLVVSDKEFRARYQVLSRLLARPQSVKSQT